MWAISESAPTLMLFVLQINDCIDDFFETDNLIFQPINLVVVDLAEIDLPARPQFVGGISWEKVLRGLVSFDSVDTLDLPVVNRPPDGVHRDVVLRDRLGD